MYHNIAKAPTGKRLSSLYTHPSLFSKQMSLLSFLGYKGLSIKDLLPYLRGEKSGKVFGISFDDGYLDNYTNALPILKANNFTATCYIVSGYIGKTNDWTRNQKIQECTLMNADQIQNWLHEGMSIGSHSHSHAHLCTLNKVDAEKEIYLSKKILEDSFKIQIEDFCFPYGEFNEALISYLEKAGYTTALTTQRGRATTQDLKLSLPRVHMTKRTYLPLFLLKMFSSYEDRTTKGKFL